MKTAGMLLLTTLAVVASSAFGQDKLVRVTGNMGEFDLQMLEQVTPKTVTNFLGYVRRGNYSNSIIHRSAHFEDGRPFVVQGGGFQLQTTNGTNSLVPVPTAPPVTNEFRFSNERGTVAMAKEGGKPHSATSQWFINLSDNSAVLDGQNGGFTVFAIVLGNGMAVADAISALDVYDATEQLGGVFSELPLRTNELTTNSLVLFRTVRALADGARPFSYDFSSSMHDFKAGFADLPKKRDPAQYGLLSSHAALPRSISGTNNVKALRISGVNRSDDLWMYWKRKVAGLRPGTIYEATFDLELASSAPEGMVGVGGAPGESVFIKAGASATEPRSVRDKEGWLRLSVDKGNQSRPGRAASVLGHAAKPEDGNTNHAIIRRDNRSSRLRVKSAADGSMWLFFGSDSGFEGKTDLYYTKFTAVLEPVGKNQTIEFPALPSVRLGAKPPELRATATSGLPVAYSSKHPGVAKVENGRLVLLGTGTAHIVATQAGNERWNAARSVRREVVVR